MVSSSMVNAQNSKVDILLWAIVLALFGAAIAGHYYLAQYSILLRLLGYVALGCLAIAVIAKTAKGRSLWSYWKDSVHEVRKMVWPTRQETVQTTIAVLGMVVVMGLLLWSTDFVLLRAVGWLTGHWGV